MYQKKLIYLLLIIQTALSVFVIGGESMAASAARNLVISLQEKK